MFASASSGPDHATRLLCAKAPDSIRRAVSRPWAHQQVICQRRAAKEKVGRLSVRVDEQGVGVLHTRVVQRLEDGRQRDTHQRDDGDEGD
jgi:hypothetical protein